MNGHGRDRCGAVQILLGLIFVIIIWITYTNGVRDEKIGWLEDQVLQLTKEVSNGT